METAKPPRQVHATPDERLDEPDKDEMEDAGAEAEHLEGELE